MIMKINKKLIKITMIIWMLQKFMIISSTYTKNNKIIHNLIHKVKIIILKITNKKLKKFFQFSIKMN